MIPGDKSISHRSIMLGALALGTTEITNFLEGADCLSTIGCFQSMGIQIDRTPEKIIVHGKGMHGLAAPKDILNVGNSGTTTRLMSGILSAQDFTSVMSGDASLNSRPMGRVITPLTQMGAHITSVNGDLCAPLKIEPGTLHGIDYTSPVASAQVKSAILLAGLYADGETSVTEPALSRNHTELMLKSFGADITSTVNPDGTATAHVKPCQELVNESLEGGEPRADILVRTSKLHGTTIEGALIPTLIDEIPMIAVMAACAEGTTIIKDAAELKVKETNRIDTTTEALRSMGADITPTDDGMIIQGGRTLHGAKINSYLDHRIAMAFAIAALSADGDTIIHDSQCVDVSYPEFFEILDGCR